MGMLSAAVSGGLILTIVGGYIGHMDTGDQAGAALGTFLLVSQCMPAAGAMLIGWLALDPAIDTNVGISRKPIGDAVGTQPAHLTLLIRSTAGALVVLAIVVLLFTAALLKVSVPDSSRHASQTLADLGYPIAYAGSLLSFAGILLATAWATWRRALHVPPAFLLLAGMWEMAWASWFVATVSGGAWPVIGLIVFFSPVWILGGVLVAMGVKARRRRPWPS